MKQRGYFDFNVTGFIIGCLIVGVAIGIGVAYLVPWLLVVHQAADSCTHRIGENHDQHHHP